MWIVAWDLQTCLSEQDTLTGRGSLNWTADLPAARFPFAAAWHTALRLPPSVGSLAKALCLQARSNTGIVMPGGRYRGILTN